MGFLYNCIGFTPGRIGFTLGVVLLATASAADDGTPKPVVMFFGSYT